MRIYLLIFLSVFTCYFNGYAQNAVTPPGIFKLPDGISSRDYMPGTIIIKFKPTNSTTAKRQSSPDAISGLLNNIKIVKIESVIKKFNSSDYIGLTSASQQSDAIGLDRIYEVKFSGDAGIEEVINELLKNDQIEYAEPSYIYRTDYVPNDPSFSVNQSYLNQVNAQQGWDLIHTASNVIIGIVDSGSDLDHPDLAANIYINTADPVDGIDNDGDGYIDNNKGWDLIGLSGTNPTGDNDPSVKSDTTMHGVHVSGIASAVTNNVIGVASIASDAKLLIVKVGADNNVGSVYLGYEGIKYAADHGAKIINCSWGGYSFSSMGQDIVNYAISKDCLIIAAAGNDNSTSTFYPASYPGVISVASVNNSDIKSSFSNFGSTISICAPGNNIYNTWYNNAYGSFSGTSMATPLVASTAALIKGYYPSYTMLQIKELLITSADDISVQNPDILNKLGSGRLNVYKALTQNLSQFIAFSALPVKTYGDADFEPGGTTNSGLPISYSSSSTEVATILNGKIHIAGAGTATITASQNGDSNYMAAPSISRTLTVNKASQTITFTSLSGKVYTDADFEPGALSSSGLPLNYTSSNTQVATIVNGKIHITGVGTDTITASQSGNTNYNPAISMSKVLTVNKAPQTITFDAIPVLLRGGPSYNLQVSSSSGLPASLSNSDPFVVSITNNSISPLRVGKAMVTAKQEGNANYLPALAVAQHIQVTDIDGSVVKTLAAVSPNNDGINDFLTIEGIRDYMANHVSVFTGNGAQVFQIDNYDNADHIFKGRSKNGNTLPEGTYFYLLQFNLDGRLQRKTGYFVLKY